jgi:hypothetical protein
LDSELRSRAKQRRTNGDRGDDGRGGVSDILAFMDDGQLVIPFSDLQFFLDRFTELGPNHGLTLSKNKTQMLTSISGISPIPFLSSSDQIDLNYCINTYTTEKKETLLGVDVLGYPIGNPKFMETHLIRTDEKLTTDTVTLFQELPSLQTSTCLFKHCLLARLPYHSYTDVLTTPLPPRHLDPFCRQTPHTRRIDLITRQALKHSTGHPDISHSSLQLAQLPTRHGGCGFYDPKFSTSAAFIAQCIRSIRYATSGIVFSKDHRHRLPSSIQSTYANWTSSSLPFFQHLLTEINIFIPIHPDLSTSDDPITLLTVEKSLSSIQTFLLKPGLPSIIERFLRFSPPEHTLHFASTRQSYSMQAILDSSCLKSDYLLSNDRFRITLRRHFRFPIISTPLPSCKCGTTLDPYGDHIFSCLRISKAKAHNKIRDCFFLILKEIAPIAKLTRTSHCIGVEPKGLLPNFPTNRPADVALKLNSNYANPLHHFD